MTHSEKVPPSPLPAKLRIFTLLVLLVGAVPTNGLAWEIDGTLICGAQWSQRWPQMVPDGSGGAYVCWDDNRAGTDLRSIYLTRIRSNGELHPGWPVDGIPLTNAPMDHCCPEIIADGVGGCYVAWAGTQWSPDSVRVAVFVTRIDPSGSPYPGWTVGGVQVSHAPSPTSPLLPRMADDGQGGVYIGWYDPEGPRAYLQHYLGDGSIAPGWSTTERALSPTSQLSGIPRVLPDGTGGVFATWADVVVSGTTRILLQHLMPDGSPDPAWPPAGVVLVDVPGGRSPQSIASDASGGVYVAWHERRFARLDIYAARVRGDGTIPPGWPANGLKLCDALEDQQAIQICEDGSGGFNAIWADLRDLFVRVYATRIDSLGQRMPGWPDNGLRVSTTPNQQLWNYALVPDGLGGTYVGWSDADTELRFQHLSGIGTPAMGWPADGIVIAPPGLGQRNPDGIPDGNGGAYVVWEDGRYGVNIYGQHIVFDGVVSTGLALVSVDAGPGEVRLRGTRVEGEGPVVIERREPEQAWRPIATVEPDANGQIEFVDRAVAAGARYGYRLGAGSPPRYTAESWIEVPGELRLALEGLRPNPAIGPLRVAFTLPNEAPATLELLDVAGRRVHAADVGTLGAGRHVITLPRGAPPGLYWLRLTQSGTSHTAKAIVAH